MNLECQVASTGIRDRHEKFDLLHFYSFYLSELGLEIDHETEVDGLLSIVVFASDESFNPVYLDGKPC